MAKINFFFAGDAADRQVQVGANYSFDFEWGSETGCLLVKEDDSVRAVIPITGLRMVQVDPDD